MLLSYLMRFDAMGQGYPSFAYAADERILVVHHNQPPPAVGERDIEGVFYVERDEEPAWRGAWAKVASAYHAWPRLG